MLQELICLYVRINPSSFRGIGMEDSVETPKMCGESLHVGVKGKRTKRRRTHRLPLSAGITVSSTSSSEFSDSMAEEEEDMANCLILLAQGEILGISHHNEGGGGGGKVNGHKLPEMATTAGDEVKFGSYTYKCRTCNKSFPSFQALGGHRTSHKRPRIAAVAVMERKKVAEEDNPKLTFSNSNYKTTGTSFFPATTTMTVGTAPAMSRVHECSICGSEFSSGQALGGHMRRHRTAMVVPAFSFSSQAEEKREKSLFDLDLNLPAPSDDEPESPSGVITNFVFARKESMIFPSLIDCHY